MRGIARRHTTCIRATVHVYAHIVCTSAAHTKSTHTSRRSLANNKFALGGRSLDVTKVSFPQPFISRRANDCSDGAGIVIVPTTDDVVGVITVPNEVVGVTTSAPSLQSSNTLSLTLDKRDAEVRAHLRVCAPICITFEKRRPHRAQVAISAASVRTQGNKAQSDPGGVFNF